MPKKSDVEEVEEVVKAITKEVNEYLAGEKPDDKQVEALETLSNEGFSSTTQLLEALADVVGEAYEDEVGATMIREFRVRYAIHELETL